METELIEEAIIKLFPPGSVRVQEPSEVRPEGRYWIIPGNEGPKWIVPQNSHYGYSVLSQWHPYNISSRIKWIALLRAYRSGLLGRLPGVTPLNIHTTEPADWSHLGRRETSLLPVIYIGTKGQSQKINATLVDMSTGKAKCLVKIPVGPQASERIIREADLLMRLAIEKPGISPKLIHSDKDIGIATQEAIAGRLTGRTFGRHHSTYLNGLLNEEGTTDIMTQVDQLQNRIVDGSITIEKTVRDRLLHVLDTLNDSSAIPSSWVHGDFVPWNIMMLDNGRVMALDWEMAEPDGLPFFDLFYFIYQQNFLFGERRNASSFLKEVATGFSCKFLEEVKICCLASMTIRYSLEGRDISFFHRELSKQL